MTTANPFFTMGDARDEPAYDPGPVADDPRLETRHVVLPDRVEVVRLDRVIWGALEEIAVREDLFVPEICTAIAAAPARPSLAADLRAYVVRYFRSALHRDRHAPPPPPLDTARPEG